MEMRDFKQVLHRTDIQEIRSFLLNGVDLANWRDRPDPKSYEARLKEGEAPLWKYLKELYPDGEKRDEAYGLACTAIAANQEVYTELGIRLGVNMIFALLRPEPLKELSGERDCEKTKRYNI